MNSNVNHFNYILFKYRYIYNTFLYITSFFQNVHPVRTLWDKYSSKLTISGSSCGSAIVLKTTLNLRVISSKIEINEVSFETTPL